VHVHRELRLRVPDPLHRSGGHAVAAV
jgi:hypothetical protein